MIVQSTIINKVNFYTDAENRIVEKVFNLVYTGII